MQSLPLGPLSGFLAGVILVGAGVWMLCVVRFAKDRGGAVAIVRRMSVPTRSVIALSLLLSGHQFIVHSMQWGMQLPPLVIAVGVPFAIIASLLIDAIEGRSETPADGEDGGDGSDEGEIP